MTGRTAPQLESMLALQRSELQRLHQLVDELRAHFSIKHENAVIVAQRSEIIDLSEQIQNLEAETARLRAWTNGTDLEGETELDWLWTGEAARLLSVHPNTLRKWVAAGKIECFRTPGSSTRPGVRRFRRVDIESARKWVV